MMGITLDKPTWQLRPAQVEDAAAISALLQQTVPSYVVSDNAPIAAWLQESIQPDAIAHHLRDPVFWYCVAVVKTDVVGMIAIRNYTHLYHLFVADAYHRQGIARSLWETAKSFAVSNGNQQGMMVRSSLYAVPVYERFGFKKTSAPLEKDGIVYVPMQCDFTDSITIKSS